MAKLVTISVTSIVTTGTLVWSLSMMMEAPSSHLGDALAMIGEKAAPL